jgi:hypothetical protein
MEEKQVLGAKLNEEEVIDRWNLVFPGEQKTGQTQWTHLPHEEAAVGLPDHHSCPKCCPAL